MNNKQTNKDNLQNLKYKIQMSSTQVQKIKITEWKIRWSLRLLARSSHTECRSSDTLADRAD